MVLVAKATSDILRAADKATPQLRAAILRALEEMRKAVPNLEGLLEAGRIDQVIDAVQVPIPDEVFATIRASLQATALTTIKPEAVTFGIEFNQVNPRAVRWAEQQAASLVSGITSPQRGPIRTAIVEGLEAGHHPRVIARHLEGLVGLTNPHQRAVDRLFLTQQFGVQCRQLPLHDADIAFKAIEGKGDDGEQAEGGEENRTSHAATRSGQGSASVRTATRRRAERARGFCATSSAVGLRAERRGK